jgi:hypothetical protein
MLATRSFTYYCAVYIIFLLTAYTFALVQERRPNDIISLTYKCTHLLKKGEKLPSRETNQFFHAEFFNRKDLFIGLRYFEVEIIPTIDDITLRPRIWATTPRN